VILLITATTFLAAFLTFLLEPLVAKMILPLFGGTPSVWNTCVLFFQAMLLAGYAYSHLAASTTRWRKLAIVHLLLLGIPLAVLPIAIGAEWAPRLGTPPVLWQLWLLLATAGLPFFAVSATTPMVQRWLSATSHQSGRDPYHLYAASNLGSLIALLAFPSLLEPALDLSRMSRLWTAGYVFLLILVAACAAATLRSAPSHPTTPIHEDTCLPRTSSRLRWFALAFIPSSLMLSVTTHLSTNVAAAPLLWVIPLAIYLATYILAFARRRLFSVALLERWMPLVVLLLAIVLLTEGLEPPPWVLFPLHLGGLFLLSLACHGQLADLRPHVSRLTEYYLWIALGGLAGGVFNALLAPALFTGIAEYPIVLVLACLIRRTPDGAKDAFPTTVRALLLKDALPAALLGLFAFGLVRAAQTMRLGVGPEAVGLSLGLPAVVCYLFLMRPVRFALALAALFLAGAWGASQSDVVFASRTYYGLHRVRHEASFNRLYHGPTLHGIQNSDPTARREPLAYYHRSGPAGSLFRALETNGRELGRIGIVGTGVGSLAAYGRAGQRWTFYELDPTVAFLAKDSGYFTFWKDSAASLRMVVGDGRISLTRETDDRYDLLILDAFSSDAVPAHLLTREALQLYLQRLTANGTLAFHISNRFLDLETVVGSLARDAGIEAVSWADLALSDAQRRAGKLPSHWVVLSADPRLTALLKTSGGWKPVEPAPGGPVWTDRFSNLLGVFRWSG
jgi:hypothetical protein